MQILSQLLWRQSLMILALSLPLAGVAVPASRYEAAWASLDRRPTPDWFLDAKF